MTQGWAADGEHQVLAAAAAGLKPGALVVRPYWSAHRRQLANRLRQVRGPQGAAISSTRSVSSFAPIDGGDGTISSLYLGPLEGEPWFPAAGVPRAWGAP